MYNFLFGKNVIEFYNFKLFHYSLGVIFFLFDYAYVVNTQTQLVTLLN